MSHGSGCYYTGQEAHSNKKIQSMLLAHSHNKTPHTSLEVEVEDNNMKVVLLIQSGDDEVEKEEEGLFLGEDAMFKLMVLPGGCLVLSDAFTNAKSSYQKTAEIVRCLTRHPARLVGVAKHLCGKNSVKELISALNMYPDLLNLVISTLRSGIFSVMADCFGSRLASYFFENLNHDPNQFEDALKNCDMLAIDTVICTSLQHCIARPRAPYRKQIVDEVIEKCADLAKHDMGCSTITFLLDFHDADVTEKICTRIVDHLEELLMDPWGSRIIQKCFVSTAGRHIIHGIWSLSEKKQEEIKCYPSASIVVKTALEAKRAQHTILEYDNEKLLHHVRLLQIIDAKLAPEASRDQGNSIKKEGLYLDENTIYKLMERRDECWLHILNDSQRSGYEQIAGIVRCMARNSSRLVEAAKGESSNDSIKELISALYIYPDLLDLVTSALATEIFGIMVHPIGSRLVSYSFENLNYDLNKFQFEAALNYCVMLAVDNVGCASLKQIIARARAPYRKEIVDKIADNCVDLAKHCDGCSMIAFLLNFYDTDVTEKICSRIQDRMEELLMHQWGSCIIKKCLVSTDGVKLLYKLERLCHEKLEEIEKSPYASDVLKTALEAKKDHSINGQLCFVVENYYFGKRRGKKLHNNLA